ncbi:heat shock protein 70 family protein, partial [Tanacetum coccineum]
MDMSGGLPRSFRSCDLDGEPITTAQLDVTTTSAPVTTAGVSVSAAGSTVTTANTAEPRTTPTTTTDNPDDEELTLAETLVKMKSSKSKSPVRVKGAAIGIDLGTTYSCAAVWFHQKRRVEIIPNEQGNKITPSFVAFSDTEILVGEGAKNQIARNPTNTVFG